MGKPKIINNRDSMYRVEILMKAGAVEKDNIDSRL